MDPLRILLVDDHLLFRKGLVRLLDAQPDFEVVGEAANGLEAVEQARVLQPDLVLMDIRMPICDGLEATRRIKAQFSGIQVVILTVSESEEDLVTAARYGTDGYLLKNLKPEVLFRQLRGVMYGEAPIARAMTGKLLRQLALHSRPTVHPEAMDTLSPRECEVLAFVAHGYSNQEIAEELGISDNTVKNHLHNILTKLKAKNRTEAAAYAVSLGLVNFP
ncbi:MAG TPA: response regulator transcription factor [Chloroflexi bacterium]|nr:response regulator transcription factor [Chloroflexota bacterium]